MILVFWTVTLRILVGFQCSWGRWNARDLYFTTHPRTLKSNKYSQSYSPKRPHFRLQCDTRISRVHPSLYDELAVFWRRQSDWRHQRSPTFFEGTKNYLEGTKTLLITSKHSCDIRRVLRDVFNGYSVPFRPIALQSLTINSKADAEEVSTSTRTPIRLRIFLVAKRCCRNLVAKFPI